MQETTKFAGVEYKTKTTRDGAFKHEFQSCEYYAPNTVGFYQMRNTFCNLDASNPYNTYLLVSDANAPTPMYDIDTSTWQDEDWNNEANIFNISSSLFLGASSSFFDEIKDIKLEYNTLGNMFYKAKTGKDWPANKDWQKQGLDWEDVFKSNIGFHYSNKEPEKEVNASGLQYGPAVQFAERAYAVFQGLRNPYTTTNLILAHRDKLEDFTSTINGKGKGKSKSDYWTKSNIGVQGLVGPANGQGYLFMLGLPNCQTGMKTGGKFTDWRATYEQYKNKKGDKRQPFADTIKAIIYDSTGGTGNDIWSYAITGVSATISDAGKNWIDAHLCPYYLWYDKGRREAGKFCSGNCTEQSIEHIALVISPEGNVYTDYYVMLLDKLYSSLSMRMNYEGLAYHVRHWSGFTVLAPADFPDNNYVFSKPPQSYITIDYHDTNGTWTGALKIVVLDEPVST